MKKSFLILITLLFPLLNCSLTCSAQTNGASFPLNFDDGYTILHSNAKVDIIVHNDGTAAITNLSYTVEDFNSGAVSGEKTTTLTAAIAQGEDGSATFKIPAGSEVGICQKIVTITKVNGVKNETSEVKASAVGYIHTLAEKVTKKTIEEEYTGTWCGWCPRGTVGMELLAENYPDNFIGVAYHFSDSFYISSHGAHEGFPEALLNRHANIDPYFGTSGNVPFGIAKDFEKEQNILPEAVLSVSATWDNEAKTDITVKSDLRFVYNTSDEFALLYLLTEDGLSGVPQSSYYSGSSDYAGDTYMAFWYNGGTTNVYNHVAVASVGRENGIDGSVASPVTVGMEQRHSCSIDISSASLVKDKTQLHLIACLLNRTTGRIINSDITTITAATDGITSIDAQNMPCTYYTLDGKTLSSQPLTTPHHSVNILRRADGTSKKVMR